MRWTRTRRAHRPRPPREDAGRVFVGSYGGQLRGRRAPHHNRYSGARHNTRDEPRDAHQDTGSRSEGETDSGCSRARNSGSWCLSCDESGLAHARRPRVVHAHKTIPVVRSANQTNRLNQGTPLMGRRERARRSPTAAMATARMRSRNGSVMTGPSWPEVQTGHRSRPGRR